MKSLKEEVHKILDDSEYDVDVQKTEKYIEPTKCAIMRTSRQMEGHLVTSTRNDTITDAHEAAATTAPTSPSTTISLSLIKHLSTSKALKDTILEEGAAFPPDLTKEKMQKFEEDAQKQKLLLGPTSYNDRLRETLDRMTSVD